MTKKEKIISKADEIIKMYEKSIELSKDECFRAKLLNFADSGVQLFGCIYDVANALGCEVGEDSQYLTFNHRGIKFLEVIDLKNELKQAQEKIKMLESQNR